MAPECNSQQKKRLAEKIAKKLKEPYASVITYIRTKLRFAFLKAPLLQYEIFKANEVMSISKTSVTDIDFS